MQRVLYEVWFCSDSRFGFLSNVRHGSDATGAGNANSRRHGGYLAGTGECGSGGIQHCERHSDLRWFLAAICRLPD